MFQYAQNWANVSYATNNKDTDMIDPFANNHQSMQVGGLVIENQKDKVIIYGDIDPTLDASGYEQAITDAYELYHEGI